MSTLGLDDLSRLLSGPVGLIVGPRATVLDTTWLAMLSRLGVSGETESYLAGCDRLEAQLSGSARKIIETDLAGPPSSPMLDALRRLQCMCVLSISIDSNLESALDEERQATPLLRGIPEVISDLALQPNPRALPIFKLLGTVNRSDFVASTAEYRWRMKAWRRPIATFLDSVKAQPVICVGFEGLSPILYDLLVEITDARSKHASQILFVDDGAAAGAELQKHVGDGTRVLRASRDPALLRAAATVGARGARATASSLPGLPLSRVGTVVTVSNRPAPVAPELPRLLDLLFSPEVNDWAPYAAGLDFDRAATVAVIDAIEAATQTASSHSTVAVHGGAACGKTTVLRRAAYALASRGQTVLWLHRSFYPDTARQLTEAFRDAQKASRKPLVVFLDDPCALGAVTPRLVVRAARTAGLPVVLVMGIRSVDWSQRRTSDFVSELAITSVHEISGNLDESEWASLPDYLVRIGAASDLADAKRRIGALNSSATSTLTRDTLCTLFYLLPRTRETISKSVRDEYRRLGDRHAAAQLVLSAADDVSPILVRRAYELAAVAARYGAALPIEICVGALGKGYGEWEQEFGTNSELWGLLYSTPSADEDTWCLRPRNDLVAEIIVDALNRGSADHAGEYQVLVDLLGGCEGGTRPVYREFCVQILTRNAGRLESILNYEQVRRLFDIAIGALPYPDRTLKHHLGILIRTRGNPLEAFDVLEEAVDTPEFPYASRGEAVEHVYTSLAATCLDAMRAGRLSVSEGKDRALGYLARARNPRFFNARAVHVNARLMIKLANEVGGHAHPEHVRLATDALADIDRTLLCLTSTRQGPRTNDEDLLREARREIVSQYASLTALREDAESLWRDNRSQRGFVAAARFLFGVAEVSDKGRDYFEAYDYVGKAMARIQADGASPEAALREVAAHTFYHWRVHRRVKVADPHAFDWDEVIGHAKSAAAASRGSAAAAFNQYLLGLALAHAKKWKEAGVVFEDLREMGLPKGLLHEARDYLLNANGAPRQALGRVRPGGSNVFIELADVGGTVEAARHLRWPRAGESTPVYVEFSFAGPRAVQWIRS